MATDTINPLLEQVGSGVAKEYYIALLHSLAAPGAVEVRADAGGNRGKGLFATQAFSEGDTIFQERPLVGIQELHSKLDTSTCANCFTAVGSVEQAFGGKICCLINELSEATEDDDLRVIQDRVDKIQAAVDSKRLEGLLSGQVELPLSDKLGLCTTPVRCRGGCDEEYCSEACASKAWAHHHCLLCPGPTQQQPASSSCSKHSKAGGSSSSSSGASSSKGSAQVTDTVHGARVNRTKLGKFLEHADDTNDIFRVAAQVIANTIITADCILQQAAADEAEGHEAAAAYSTAVAAAAAAGHSAPQRVLAAAGPAAATATAAQLAAAVPDEGTEQGVAAAAYQAAAAAAAAAGSSSQQVLAPATAADAASKPQPQVAATKEQCLAALKAAFLPYALGKKELWWDLAQEAREAAAAAAAAARDDDVSSSDEDSSDDVDPVELAAQMRELAAESLALLRAGLQDTRFPELFDLQLYGSLVGMFELNNLNLAVPAPVQRYKALLEDPSECEGVSAAQAAAALHEVTPLLEALGEEADGPAEGTGFFALQSTMNHSCAPNTAADCDPSGQLVVSALQDIPAGAELLLSYIEEEGTDLADRRAMLWDYGFTCACSRCEAETLAVSLQEQL